MPSRDELTKPTRRVLEPSDRIAEILFGLIMVLTFTGSLSVAQADRTEVRTMLIGALGCNIVWGVIDAVLYLLGCLDENRRRIKILRLVRTTPDSEAARSLIAEALPPVVSEVMRPEELEAVRLRLKQQPEPIARSLHKNDLLGAFGVFLLVFFATIPVVLPFLFLSDLGRALWFSHTIAIVMLFLAGYAYGKCADLRPWLSGLSMVVLGAVLVGLTIALGG